MQYLLKQIEYDELVHLKKKHTKKYLDELQMVCTMACDNTPILYWDNKEPKPWECIISINKLYDDVCEWSCDECPVQNICPYEYKVWSK